jgi:signal transduction histidine kinase
MDVEADNSAAVTAGAGRDATPAAALGVVLHELRALVGSVTLAASTLLEHAGDEVHRQLAQDVLGRSLDRLERLSRQMLPTLADGAELPVVMSRVDLAETVDDVIAAFPRQAGTDVRTELTATEATADPDRLWSALSNVLANVYRHGGPNVVIRSAYTADGVVVDVADDGGGVPADMRTRMFEPFVTAEVRPGPSRGLGLAMARRAMRAMGGDIAVADGVPGWTTIRMTLPHRT